jgi:dihydroorotase-like cyclic amidohydrolase
MSSFIIKDIRIFDGHSSIENGYIHVSGSKIQSFGSGSPPSSITTSNPDIKTISKPGHTLLPGFIDAHNHLHQGNIEALKQALRFGVTTIMDLHNEVDSFMLLKRVASEDRVGCADFKCAGIAATIENGWPVPVVLAHDKSPEVRFPSQSSMVDGMG